MSRTPSTLSRPSDSDPIPEAALTYFRVRNKQRLYELVLNEFIKSGLSQAELARRLSKAPEVVCRLLGAPGNWRLDTVSDFLFAISGAEPAYDVSYPLERAPRNYVKPDWLQNDGGWPAIERQVEGSANTSVSMRIPVLTMQDLQNPAFFRVEQKPTLASNT